MAKPVQSQLGNRKGVQSKTLPKRRRAATATHSFSAEQIVGYFTSSIERFRPNGASISSKSSERGQTLKVREARGNAVLFLNNMTPGSGTFIVSSESAVRIIRLGVRARFVSELARSVPTERAKLLRTIGIDKATLKRREQADKLLDEDQSAGVIRAMEVTTAATEAFGTVENASRWLNKPHPLLDRESPLEYARNEYGLTKVKSILAAIRFGGVV